MIIQELPGVALLAGEPEQRGSGALRANTCTAIADQRVSDEPIGQLALSARHQYTYRLNEVGGFTLPQLYLAELTVQSYLLIVKSEICK